MPREIPRQIDKGNIGDPGRTTVKPPPTTSPPIGPGQDPGNTWPRPKPPPATGGPSPDPGKGGQPDPGKGGQPGEPGPKPPPDQQTPPSDFNNFSKGQPARPDQQPGGGFNPFYEDFYGQGMNFGDQWGTGAGDPSKGGQPGASPYPGFQPQGGNYAPGQALGYDPLGIGQDTYTNTDGNNYYGMTGSNAATGYGGNSPRFGLVGGQGGYGMGMVGPEYSGPIWDEAPNMNRIIRKVDRQQGIQANYTGDPLKPLEKMLRKDRRFYKQQMNQDQQGGTPPVANPKGQPAAGGTSAAGGGAPGKGGQPAQQPGAQPGTPGSFQDSGAGYQTYSGSDTSSPFMAQNGANTGAAISQLPDTLKWNPAWGQARDYNGNPISGDEFNRRQLALQNATRTGGSWGIAQGSESYNTPNGMKLVPSGGGQTAGTYKDSNTGNYYTAGQNGQWNPYAQGQAGPAPGGGYYKPGQNGTPNMAGRVMQTFGKRY